MTISIWRYSHLALAISSFLFLILASVTGVILSFKPISEKVQPYSLKNFNELNVASLFSTLEKNFTDIIEVKIDDNQFVVVDATTLQNVSGKFYFDPNSSKVLGAVKNENAFFQWVTAFHRSLFLHQLGRFFIGLTSFILFLIATSGSILIIQRLKSVKGLFSKIEKDSFAQYYHIVLGRLSLIPIIIISLSGVVLCLQTFDLLKESKVSPKIDFDGLKTSPKIEIKNFDVFQRTKLSDVKSIEFPFTEDVEDFYLLKLDDREITVNQITGEVLATQRIGNKKQLLEFSLDLHTGRTSAAWAIILAVASGNILFFVYSGFIIWWKRSRVKIKNNYKSDQAEVIILVGSENGTTLRYAQAVHQLLVKNGQFSYLDELNNYKVYPKAKRLIVLTATYGVGEPPTNAKNFTKLLAKYKQPNEVDFSVVAFGSHAYPEFCKFGFDVHNLVSQQEWASPLLEIHTVNARSPEDFKSWTDLWAQKNQIELGDFSLSLENYSAEKTEFKVLDKCVSNNQNPTLIIGLKQRGLQKFKSGDLLKIYPAGDHQERLYSVGIVDKRIQLCVKLHQGGLGSGYLNKLTIGETFSASLVKNAYFHFPKKASSVIMISNGTGIAPFLGMFDQHRKGCEVHLYCGFRDQLSFQFYEPIINHFSNHLTSLNVAYSQEGKKQYVRDLLIDNADLVLNTLRNKGVIMICGSLNMQSDVLQCLEGMLFKETDESISFYQSKGQILMDCY